MPQILNAETGAPLGDITDAQLAFLIAQLEEESSTDRDYYITADTLDYFASRGADPALLTLLRGALGDRAGIEVRWA